MLEETAVGTKSLLPQRRERVFFGLCYIYGKVILKAELLSHL